MKREVDSFPRVVHCDGLAGHVDLSVARALGRLSRAWGQTGLGTLYKAASRLPLLGRGRCVVELRPGSVFSTVALEPYWGPSVVGGRPYEPELLHSLRMFTRLRPVFADCGANFGYWSILASGPELNYETVVAIEANRSTFDVLAQHAAMNGNRFTCLLGAVSSRTGVRVTMTQTSQHAVARIADPGVGGDAKAAIDEVETVRVDDALAQVGWTPSSGRPVVVKLDVEGHEMAAIEGARTVSRVDHAFIVEDFRARRFSTIASLLERDYRIHYVTPGGRCHQIGSVRHAVDEVVRIGRANLANNFIATPHGGDFEVILDDWAVRTRT